MRLMPGILGALLVMAGVAVVFWPLALVVAGGFLLLLDHRMPPAVSTPKPRPRGDEVR